MGHLVSGIKPGYVLVSITEQKEKKEKLILGEATRKQMEEAAQASGTHPVEKVLMVGEGFYPEDAIKVEEGDRVIVNPFAQVIRVRLATGKVAGLLAAYDLICVVEG